jgi:hypothetical protein
MDNTLSAQADQKPIYFELSRRHPLNVTKQQVLETVPIEYHHKIEAIFVGTMGAIKDAIGHSKDIGAEDGLEECLAYAKVAETPLLTARESVYETVPEVYHPALREIFNSLLEWSLGCSVKTFRQIQQTLPELNGASAHA